MSFADHLKQVRKEKGLSQEELAELLNVSRQTVSKWEQGVGYPEVEKLLLLSNRLNVSLGALMAAEIVLGNNADQPAVTGQILITSPHENVIASCCKVMASQKMKGGKSAPQYALFGVGATASFWGEPITFLGWYADEEQISNEIRQIQLAIAGGLACYELKHAVKVERRWLDVKMVED